ncbi:MAG: hypothetical protein ACM31G_07095 [Flavobacteriales bacterium]
MKHFYFVILFFLSISVFSQTSLTEYNYLTKGYAKDLADGRDIKNGYAIIKVDGESTGVTVDDKKIHRAVRYSKFIKTQDSVCVALLVEFERADTKHKNYICIPSPKSDPEVLNLAQSDFYKQVTNLNDENIIGWQYLWNTLKLLGKLYTN